MTSKSNTAVHEVLYPRGFVSTLQVIGEIHAASSGLVASPNPIAAIPFARASGKDYFRTTIFFPANFVTCLPLSDWMVSTISRRERIHQTTLNCNITPNISSILQRLFPGGIKEAARQHG